MHSNYRYPLHPFDFFSNLLCTFSNQVIHMVIEFEGHINPDILLMAVENATFAEPVTRCRITQYNNSLFFEPDPETTNKRLLICMPSPDPPSVLHKALSQSVEPGLGPLVNVVLIQGEGSSHDIMVINAHHMSMDGRGLKDFVHLIFSQYDTVLSGISSKPQPSPLKKRILPRIASIVSSDSTSVDVPDQQISWAGDFSVPCISMESTHQVYSLLYLGKERTKTMNAVRREWNATLNDLMLAIIAQSCAYLSEKKGEQVISLLNTIDLRRYLSLVPDRSVENYSTAFEVNIPVMHGEPLRETVRRVKSRMDAIKKGSPGLDGAMEVERLFDMGYEKASSEINERWMNNLKSGKRIPLFSNTGVISKEMLDLGISVRHAYILPTHSLAPGFFFAVSNYEDQITLSATYYLPAYDQKLIARLFNIIDRIIPGFSDNPGIYRTIL